MGTKVDFSIIEKYESLPTIIKLREIIRKLWKLEIGFMNSDGFVIDHARGKIVPPLNRFCQEALFCPKGLECCDKSVSELNKLLKTGAYPNGCVFDGMCHLGLKMIAVPYYQDGKYIGAVFSCGFLTEKPVSEKINEINSTLGKYTNNFINPSQIAGEISIIKEGSIQYLLDLIRFGINELESFRERIKNKEDEITDLNRQLREKYRLGSIIGKTAIMQRLFMLIEKVADCDSTVLITGENGTGKELVAKAIHYASSRKDRRFVAQNCSAFNDNLLDSELFGHVKGAFTGAIKNKKGLFEVADGGTFLLDEIGDMSASLQVKILRVLQEGTFMPVGGTEPKKVDVRIIAVTNRDLKKMVEKGEFREDLYYRINVIHVNVPALRDRRDDIPLLIENFIKKNSRKLKRKDKTLSPKTVEMMMSYYWPGNVRQLENEIEKLFVLCAEEEVITENLLSSEIKEGSIITSDIPLNGDLRSAVVSLEKKMILDGLKKHNWNKSQLAKDLGISRASLIMKVSKFGFERDSFNA